MTRFCQFCQKVDLTGRHPALTLCDNCNNDYHKLKTEAMNTLNFALSKNTIIRPEICEGCNKSYPPVKVGTVMGEHYRSYIVAHHYAGHENPLDVMWLCMVCNLNLPGPKYHSGQFTKAETRQILLKKLAKEQSK